MQNIKNLIAEGKNIEALQELAASLEGEEKNAAILCLNQFNTYQKAVLKGIEYYDPIEINKIMWRALLLCDHKILAAIEKGVAQPPMLDNLPLDKEGYLLGRKAALAQLHTTLQGGGIMTLVNGMGGIGKSTLAAFYANLPQYRAAYQHCFWITVSDLTGEIEEALITAFLVALELYQMPKEAQLQKIQAYLRSLDKPVLLIIDNANYDENVDKNLDYLQKMGCKVLLTTRANIQGITQQYLSELLPEDAFTLFTHYFAAGKDHPLTRQLLQNIKYHTLLTEFMAKFLNTNPAITIEQLLEITAQQDFTNELLAYTKFKSYHTHTHTTPYEKIQPAKYLLQIFPIQNLSEQEQEILRYFSILPAEWIGMDMLLQLFIDKREKTETKSKGFFSTIKNLFSKPKEVAKTNHISNDLELGQILQGLYEKGWLQKSPKNEFACHILVQHILRQQLQPNAENCKLFLQSLYAVIEIDNYTNQLTLALYLPLVAVIFTWIKEDIQLIADIYNNSAIIYKSIGNYAQALIYDLENIRIKEKILAADDADLSTAYNNISTTYRYLGLYQEALEYGLKALSIRKKVLSTDNPSLANSYNNISVIYLCKGNYKQALEYGLKALDIFKKGLNAELPNLAGCYNNIGEIYRHLGDYQQALEYGLKALAIREKLFNAEYTILGESYNNIANVYQNLKDYQQALEYQFKAISIYEKQLSPEHPNLATIYNNIGENYRHLVNYQQALEYQFKAISIYEKQLSPEHPNLANFYNNIALIYQNLKDYEQALEYQFKAISIYEKQLSPEHPNLANSYYNISNICYHKKDYFTAYIYIEKAFVIWIKILPKQHPNILNVLNGKIAIEKAILEEYI